MTHDEELIEKVARSIYAADMASIDCSLDNLAAAAITAVRSYDREQRAKIDADLALHIDEALARHNDAQHGGASTYVDPAQPVALGYWSRRMAEARRREMSGDAIADAAPASDPDDYRDPFALVTRMDSAPGIKT